MERIVLFWFLSLLTASFCYWLPTNAQEKDRQQDVNRLFDALSDGAEKQDPSRNDLNDDVQPYRRKRVCSLGGGMSNQCTAVEIDRQMKMREKLMSGHGPGKRRVQTRSTVEEDAADPLAPDNMGSNRRQEQATERKGLQLLMEILSQIDSESTHKKRACQFNLGGHCSTESAAFLADRWHYLDSALSPGRKRSPAAVGITRKLVQGKLFTDND